MRKCYLILLVLSAHVKSSAQETITFDDGTTVDVNYASFNYNEIKKLSTGFVLQLDGLAGYKYFMASYLQPEKFHIAANLGFASVNLESTIFFTGKTFDRKKGFAVKYESGGYNTVKQYVLKQAIPKRREYGLYLSVNDYGHLLKVAEDDDKLETYSVTKQTKVYAGISTVNYWHANLNVDDDKMKRGQFIGRTILAPFVTFGSVADTANQLSIDDAPKYGARLMYELSNTFGLMGAKVRGRTNLLLRLGIDVATDKNKHFYKEVIFGFGVVFNFLGKSPLD